MVPVDVFPAPFACEETLPPNKFPVIVSVPVEEFNAPLAPLADPPVQFPTIEAADGVADENVTQAVADDPANEFAVNVTPLESVNVPPAVAPPVVSFRTSRQVADAVTATARLFEIAVSPAIGGPNPGAPAGVVDHVLVALKFPAATA